MRTGSGTVSPRSDSLTEGEARVKESPGGFTEVGPNWGLRIWRIQVRPTWERCFHRLATQPFSNPSYKGLVLGRNLIASSPPCTFLRSGTSPDTPRALNPSWGAPSFAYDSERATIIVAACIVNLGGDTQMRISPVFKITCWVTAIAADRRRAARPHQVLR